MSFKANFLHGQNYLNNFFRAKQTTPKYQEDRYFKFYFLENLSSFSIPFIFIIFVIFIFCISNLLIPISQNHTNYHLALYNPTLILSIRVLATKLLKHHDHLSSSQSGQNLQYYLSTFLHIAYLSCHIHFLSLYSPPLWRYYTIVQSSYTIYFHLLGIFL